MRKILQLLLACVLIHAAAGAQTTLYVDSSVTSSGAGTSWSAAYKTLSEALTFVNGASTTTRYVIDVAKGTYYPTGVQNATNRDSAFFITRGWISIEGGYPTGGGTRNITGNPTTLSGNIGLASDSSDNSYHIMVIAGVTTIDTISLSGLTFTRGEANGATNSNKLVNAINVTRGSGGGIAIYGNGNSILVSDCIFLRNYASDFGGGISGKLLSSVPNTSVSSSKLVVKNTAFNTNTGFNAGGGVYIDNDGSSDTLSGCSFTGNYSNLGGGACINNVSRTNANSFAYFVNCSFSNNATGIYGQAGGLYLNCWSNTYANPGTASVVSCSFTGNSSNQGGGMYAMAQPGYNSPTYLSITSCTFTGNSAGSGGGLYNYASGSSYNSLVNLIVSNSVFAGNQASGQGGGMYNFHNTNSSYLANLNIRSCLDSGNTAGTNGGGMYNYYVVKLDSVNVIRNTAANGGGMYNEAGSSPISRCIIMGNTATNGAGMYNQSSTATFKSCLIAGNRAGANGGAMYNHDGATPSIVNCTLANDSALAGPGLYNSSSTSSPSSPVVTSSILWEGSSPIYNINNGNPVITYSTVSGGYTGTGNLSSNPLFINPSTVGATPTTLGNYNILPCSPAVNAGLNSGSYAGVADLAGNARLFGTTVDQGAYELQSTFPVPITGTLSAVCVNSTIQLSHSVSGGTWASVNTSKATVSNTGIVTGLVAGTDTITYTYTSGSCTGTATKIITINPLPVINTISSPSASICSGGQMLLSNSTSGGAWSSSNTSIATISSTGSFSALSAGTDTVFYAVTTVATGCADKAMSIITVNATPVVASIGGNSNVCIGDSILLTDATANGVWRSNNTSLATISQNGMLVSHSPGGLFVIYTVTSTAGCKDSVFTPVTVVALPSIAPISGPHTVCINGSGQLQSNTPNGVWSSRNAAVAAITGNGTIIPASYGNTVFVYTVTNAAGCSDSATYSVSVDTGDVHVTQSGALLNAVVQTGASYQWVDCNNANNPISGETNSSFTATESGSYAVVISKNGCTYTSACLNVTGLGVNNNYGPLDAVSIYPNPGTGVFIISIPAAMSVQVKVSDMTGKQLLSFAASGTKSIDLGKWGAGIYLVTMNDGKTTRTSRVTVIQ